MRLVFETYKLVSGIPPPPCSPRSLFSHSSTHGGGGESIKLLSGAFSCPSSYFRASILAKNLCQPTCWHVFKRRPRAGESEHRHIKSDTLKERRWKRMSAEVTASEGRGRTVRKMEVEGKVERRGGKRKRVGAGLEVELLVCSVGFRLVRRKNALDEEEKGTVVYRGEWRSTPQGVHAHTCNTHARVTPFSWIKTIRDGERDTGRGGGAWTGGRPG